MGIEEDLSNMLRYISLGGKGELPVNAMLKTLVNTVEVNALRKFQGELAKMQEKLNERVSELTKQKPATGPGRDIDPFNILGISPDATKEEVKKAFREKAEKAHPDKGGSNSDMIMVNAAYEAIMRFKGWK